MQNFKLDQGFMNNVEIHHTAFLILEGYHYDSLSIFTREYHGDGLCNGYAFLKKISVIQYSLCSEIVLISLA